MSESKYTPGPWQMHDEDYAPEEIYGDLEHVEGHARGTQVCTCEPCDQMIANARLIAAAPELLSAAEHILALLDHPTWSVTILDADVLRAAIAKAKGETKQ